MSLWAIIKEMIGKDLTRVCLPVYFNEPLSALQKIAEDLEYSELLDKVRVGWGLGRVCGVEGMGGMCRILWGGVGCETVCVCIVVDGNVYYCVCQCVMWCVSMYIQYHTHTLTHTLTHSPPHLSHTHNPHLLHTHNSNFSHTPNLSQAALCPKGSTERLVWLAAFAISGYSGTINRTSKPFNPLLGETYELVFQEKVCPVGGGMLCVGGVLCAGVCVGGRGG